MSLEDDLRRKIRSQGKADSTADVYWSHVKNFLLFAKQKRGEWVHPKDMGRRQVEIWLSHLANEKDLSANSQNQAFETYLHTTKDGATAARSPIESLAEHLANPPAKQEQSGAPNWRIVG